MSVNPRVWLPRQLLACLLFVPGLALAAPFAYITNGISSTVSVIDTASNAVVATIPVGLGPFGVAVAATGSRVYVANGVSNSVSIIDAATNVVVATVPIGVSPAGVAINLSGTRVYTTNPDANNVSVIDTSTKTVVATVAVGKSPGGIAVSSASTRVYVANGDSNSISVIDAATNTVVATVAVGSSPAGIAVHPAGTLLYVAMEAPDNLSVIDTATNAVVATVPVGATPTGVALNPLGTRVYVANADSNNVSVIDTATNTVVATVTVGTAPAGISVNPLGTRVYVANYGSNNVSVIDTATNMVVAIIPVGLSPIALGQFIEPATPALDINQHGLTGSWFKQVTSGQGIEVEVFPSASGTGSTFVSWFTYDTAVGGADHQRWYTAQGQVVTGQPSASLTIYQNTGGNFSAPPATTAQPVGTATLNFDTCTSGQLSYTFSDGRSGVIPLSRLTQNVTCSTTAPHPTNADFALSGNWFGGAGTSGQGITAEVNPISGAFFAAWYTYIPNGTASGAAGQRWYTAQGAFTPGMRSIPVTIYETTGGVFDTPTPPGQSTRVVGSGTMTFNSCIDATFSYNFTGGSSSGLSGSIPLARVGPAAPGCTS